MFFDIKRYSPSLSLPRYTRSGTKRIVALFLNGSLRSFSLSLRSFPSHVLRQVSVTPKQSPFCPWRSPLWQARQSPLLIFCLLIGVLREIRPLELRKRIPSGFCNNQQYNSIACIVFSLMYYFY